MAEVEVPHQHFPPTNDVESSSSNQHPSLGNESDNEIVTKGSAFVRSEHILDDQGPPKVESAIEVLDEKVTKQVIKEGHGPTPTKFSTCFLHYRAWAEKTLFKFDDTWQEQGPVEVILGKEKKEMKGLGIGLSFCNLDCHEIASSAKLIRYPDVDFWESASPTQFASVYVFSIGLFPP